MRRHNRLFTLLSDLSRVSFVTILIGACMSAFVCSAPAAHAQSRPLIGNGTKHARATIEAISSSALAARVLVTLTVDPGWHISWRNPGETGLPTRLSWALPADVSASGETWPVPIVTQTTVGSTHTLEGSVPWLVDFVIHPARVRDGTQTREPVSSDRLVTLTIRYGVCRDVCIPEQLTVQGALPARAVSHAVPVAAQSRLASSGGVIAARRISVTRLCLVSPPLVDGAKLPDVVGDSGAGLDVTLKLEGMAGSHVKFMNTPAAAVLRTGSALLFVRGDRAVASHLDFQKPAAGCRSR